MKTGSIVLILEQIKTLFIIPKGILFAVFNITRFMKIDPIKTLEKGRRKFEQRFRYLQVLLKRDQKDPHIMTSKELDEYWKQVKSVLSPKSNEE